MKCEASMEYTCNSDGVWSGIPTMASMKKCIISDPRSVGIYREACDPGDQCPVVRPEPGAPCGFPGFYPDSGCTYNHVVMGCPGEELNCGGTAFAQCVKNNGYNLKPVPDGIIAPPKYIW